MDSANISLSTLTALNEAFRQGNAAYRRIGEDVEIARANYFRQFNECLTLIRDKVVHAGERLEHAKRNLRFRHSQWVTETAPDGTTSTHPADSTFERRMVELAQRHYDGCREALSEAEKIIESCNTHCLLSKGVYNIIADQIERACDKLTEVMNIVAEYNSISPEAANSLLGEEPMSTGEYENKAEDSIVLTFIDSDGKPIRLNVQIVDNALFGFQTINMTTDDKGQLCLTNVRTTDCGIYVNGHPVYRGPLTGNLEFKEYV